MKKIVVLRTGKLDVFSVAVTDLDEHEQAGEIREFIGDYPLDLANIVAQQEGERRGLPIFT